ncbi:Probable calcium-binding protein CML27 [Linum perenne]
MPQLTLASIPSPPPSIPSPPPPPSIPIAVSDLKKMESPQKSTTMAEPVTPATYIHSNDTNSDDKISISELAGVFRSMGTEYSPPDLQRAMEEVDTDKDDFILPSIWI